MEGWKSETVLKTVLKGLDERVTLINREHKIAYINRPPVGYSVAQVIGKRVADLVVPDDRDTVTTAFDTAFATGMPDRLEVAFPGPEGTLLWSCRVLPIVDNGVTSSLAVLSTNVTEQRLEEAERKRFFNLSKDLLCTATLQGYFKSVSPAFTALLGYDEAELLSKPFTSFVHPDDVQPTVDIIVKMGEDGSIDDFENRYLGKDGTYYRIYWRGVYDLKTELIYAVGRDITEKRRLEEQLLQSQKLDAVGQLAGGLAHDINNIVLAVMMNAELAARNAKSPLAIECLREIITAGERASAVTQQLLSFSKSDVFQPSTVDLRDVVSDLYSMIRRLLPESMEVQILLGDEPICASVDQGQIEQVIVNLCINARDAMPAAGGKLQLAIEAGEDDGAVIRVIDNGIGMSATTQQRIFEPYFTTKERGLGTGLGLPSVYTVLSRHGGRIDVTSAPNQGCEMRVWLPRSAEETTAPASPDITSTADISGRSILVAEDDAQVRNVVVQVLRAAGLDVHVAVDGVEAIALLPSVAIDIALLDLVMPKASGHEVFEALRKRFPQVPIIFSTGYADGRLPEEVLTDEQVALLRKPYRPEALLAALRSLLHPES